MYRPYRGLAALACVGLALLVVGCPSGPPVDHAIAPVASFEANPVVDFAPLRVQFSDTSNAGTSPIRQWHWVFGDGAESMDRNPAHTYMLPGVYTVSLTVTTAAGTDQRVCIDCITVKEPSTVVSMDADGGAIDTEGAGLAVPPGVLPGATIFGMTYNEGTVPVTTSAGERLVSDLFGIYQNAGDLRGDPRNPMVLTIPVFIDMIPEADRTPDKVQIFAHLLTGPTVPILGALDGSNFVASISGLPLSAMYAVVYRPAGQSRTIDVEAVNTKTPTPYAWPSDMWRVFYTATNLQELTGLRLGDLINLGLYDVRTYAAVHVNNTIASIEENVARIHAAYRDAGFISPLLARSDANEYRLIFFNMNRPARTNYSRLSDVTFAASVFGDIVIDPGQLIAICKKNATLGVDQNQEMEVPNALAQELFRASFRGYDFPKAMGAPSVDYTPVLFSQGMEDAMATYLGQIMDGITIPRSLGTNEYSMLDEGLFTPISTSITGYSYAGQDFLFYVAKATGTIAAPPSYIADSYNGMLEYVRLQELALGADPLYDEALAAALLGCDNGLLQASFHRSLSDLYWEFARNRAYENNDASQLRISEGTREPYTLNTSAFAASSQFSGTFSNAAETLTYSGDYIDSLAAIPPLASRVFVFSTGAISADLLITVNAADWNGSLRAKVYRDGMDGVELSTLTPSTTLTGFGTPHGFTRAVVIVSNVSLDQAYSLNLTAETQATSLTIPTGSLSGTVTDAATTHILPGASIVVRLRDGSTVGGVLGSATANSEGVYLLPSIVAGEVEVTVSMLNYVTQRIDTTITANVSNTLDVDLVHSK